ncbi:MAG TPA: sensor histidine kinase KdpD [Ktedonobacterales bacterium]
MASDERPNPDELLDRYGLRDNRLPTAPAPGESGGRQVARGRLRIYLGMAAGVGKTYAMLGEGLRRKARGTDVVVGYAETHRRPLTEAQLGDLEVIPRQVITYRGVSMQEMDLDAILARRPAVALVDELAHTNVPGARHEKRYEDVEELLAAGITVITTLNIQHLEGMNDLVESITGVRQRETVPDRVLDEADEVELVDISPEALRARMRHGNIYAPAQAERALSNYFTQSNLTALRELALRRMMEKTESQLDSMMRGSGEEPLRPEAAAERVLAVFSDDPSARQVLREAWRLARGLRGELIAVAVREPHPPTNDQLARHLQLAEDLGAETLLTEAQDLTGAIITLARERGAAHIVLGVPSLAGWRQLRFALHLTRLLRAQTGADLHLITAEVNQREP